MNNSFTEESTAKAWLTASPGNGQTFKIVFRTAFFTVLLLGAAAPFAPLMKGQQIATPAGPAGTGDNQSQQSSGAGQLQPGQQPTAVPGLGQLGQIGARPGQDSTTDQTKLPAINPKTGLPWTPEELRDREIDKFDPTKHNVDFSGQDDTNTDGSQNNQQDPNAQAPGQRSKPLPGSVAAMNADAAAGMGGAQGGDSDYTGPAVLSRSYTLSRPTGSRSIAWSAGLSFSISRDVGQEPTATAGGGAQYESITNTGASMGWSLSGQHVWTRDQLGLSYSGNFSDYTGSLSGVNHSMNLDYSHVVSQRISIQVVEGGQEYSQNYSLENPALEPGASIANINFATSPSTELVTGVTRQSSTSVSMTLRQTARLSYNLSGGYFITGRTQGVGMWGHQASADVNYRWTPKMTVGSYFSYTNYTYAHGVASSDSYGLGGIYSYAFNRRMQLQTRIGASRIESLAFSTVPLPEELALVLGESQALVNAYSLHWTSDISAQLVRDFGRSRTASLAYAHGESPGNGVLLTSVQQTVSAGLTMSLRNGHLPLSTGFVYSDMEATSLGQINSSQTETVYVGTSRPLGHGVSGTLRIDYRRYNISGTTFDGTDYRVSLGLTWGVPENIMRKL